jgi:hypothetical protein
MNVIMKCLLVLIIYFAVMRMGLTQTVFSHLTQSEAQEELAIVTNINHSTLTYKSATLQQMLVEANYFSDHLKLPTVHPIQITDVQYPFIASPMYNWISDTNFPYFSTNISREKRLHTMKIGVGGTIETTNFFFSFHQGKLWDVDRQSEHEMEFYADHLDQLVGKPSLINDEQAHKLATQWLAAVDVDVTALEKQSKATIRCARYQPKGATNLVFVPIYFVQWGTNHSPKYIQAYEPAVEVKILGTTKELLELSFNDTTFSHRPLLLITNALDLVRTPNPPMKHL